MVTFLNKVNDIVNIRLISTDTSRMVAAVNGADVVNLDDMIASINSDPNIKHINICVSYFDDENKIMDFIVKQNAMKNNNSNGNSTECCNKENNTKEDNKKFQQDNTDFKCPECGENECLVDRHGKKYPCLQCIQIDIGQKLMKKYMDEFSGTVMKNNVLIEELCKIFENSKKEQEEQKNVLMEQEKCNKTEPSTTEVKQKKTKKSFWRKTEND